MYFVQLGKYGINWQNEEIEEDSFELQDYIDVAFELELHDGRYHARVIDDNERVYCEIAEPYGGVRINILNPNLDAIRTGYSIDDDVFAKACRDWLENFETNKQKKTNYVV